MGEKRSDREVEKLFKTLETVSEIKDNQIDKVSSAGKDLQDLKSQLDVAIDRCDSIIDNQSQYDTAKALELKRELRKTEWEAFVVDMDAKLQKVDETFQEKENELKEFYCDLERKLHLTSD
ncbi:biogenesis of lysosome-related organelles complex 1 subunit 5 [Nilaparvata lugens]|uniref:biogenesis of lysosome-related organelles complex 1 subunit 5 n=1 Tax=Nilaparvata lugens TaxID=108931 RepID=UPI00193CBB41|nr:biogenesis of lysosome-related organelles complex 1 subunit 5 [Nilaparvata lugens]